MYSTIFHILYSIIFPSYIYNIPIIFHYNIYILYSMIFQYIPIRPRTSPHRRSPPRYGTHRRRWPVPWSNCRGSQRSSYGKISIFNGKSTISMAMFNSSVKLPKGTVSCFTVTSMNQWWNQCINEHQWHLLSPRLQHGTLPTALVPKWAWQIFFQPIGTTKGTMRFAVNSSRDGSDLTLASSPWGLSWNTLNISLKCVWVFLVRTSKKMELRLF